MQVHAMNLAELLGGGGAPPRPTLPQADALALTLAEKLALFVPKTFARGALVMFIDGLEQRPDEVAHLPMIVIGMRSSLDPTPGDALRPTIMATTAGQSRILDIEVISTNQHANMAAVLEDSRYLIPWTQEESERRRLKIKAREEENG